jgi:nucleotide-binding universal stress UspA family protein
VGVDGSSASLAAADYAVDEAMLRRAPLQILYGHIRRPLDRFWWRTWDPFAIMATRRMLEAVANRARTRGPAVDVTVDMVLAEPGAALVERSRHAQLVVVGHAGRGGAVLGSVAGHVAAHATSPVIVHRHVESGSTRHPIMVGVDGSAMSADALHFALDEAALRGVGLEAVLVWSHPLGAEPAGVHPVAYDYAEAKAEAERMLAEQLAGLMVRSPDVRVTREVIHSLDSAGTLLELSRRAQLVVVGSRGRGGIARLLLGSVSQALVNRAFCPVGVVRPGVR